MKKKSKSSAFDRATEIPIGDPQMSKPEIRRFKHTVSGKDARALLSMVPRRTIEAWMLDQGYDLGPRPEVKKGRRAFHCYQCGGVEIEAGEAPQTLHCADCGLLWTDTYVHKGFAYQDDVGGETDG